MYVGECPWGWEEGVEKKLIELQNKKGNNGKQKKIGNHKKTYQTKKKTQ